MFPIKIDQIAKQVGIDTGNPCTYMYRLPLISSPTSLTSSLTIFRRIHACQSNLYACTFHLYHTCIIYHIMWTVDTNLIITDIERPELRTLFYTWGDAFDMIMTYIQYLYSFYQCQLLQHICNDISKTLSNHTSTIMVENAKICSIEQMNANFKM